MGSEEVKSSGKLSASFGETKQLGKDFAETLIGGEVIGLVGNLGSGKTTFVQGMAEGLGIEKRILSPTFILMREYNTGIRNKELRIKQSLRLRLKSLYHLDLYRLEKNIDIELKNLGVVDVWNDKRNVVVIEWAEKAKKYLPMYTKWIEFEYIDENTRRIDL